MNKRHIAGVTLCGIFGISAVLSTASAATFVVNALNDAVDDVVGDDICATAANTCTLRAAVMEANAKPDADIIELSVAAPRTAPYVVSIRNTVINPWGESPANAAEGDMDISSSVTIRGTDPAQSVIWANGNVGHRDRMFQISPAFGPNPGAIEVTFENVTMTGGFQPQENAGGGAILVSSVQNGPAVPVVPKVVLRNVVLETNYSYVTGAGLSNYGGDVLIEDSVIRQNRTPYTPNNTSGGQNNTGGGESFAGGGQGGGLANWSGIMTIRRSVIDDNIAQVGGGIYNQDASSIPSEVILEDSLVTANQAFMGAGIFSMARGTWDFQSGGSFAKYGLVLNRSVMETNIAEFAGGAIYNIGSALVNNSNIVSNSSQDAVGNPNYRNKGGGIYNSGRVFDIVASTVAGNEAQDVRTQSPNADESYGGDEIFIDYANATSGSPQNSQSYRFTIQNSIIGDGPPSAPDLGAGVDDNCNGPAGYEGYIQSQGNNIDSGSTCFAAPQGVAITSLQPTDITNPANGVGLAAPEDNGSLSNLPDGAVIATRALQPGSPAIGAGAGCPGSDGRGFARVGGCDIGAFQVAVDETQGGNGAPTPQADLISTTAGAQVSVKVLYNDRDPDATDNIALVPGSVTAPANGAATISGSEIVYLPAAGFGATTVAEDTFSYDVSDGTASATAVATVVVYPPDSNNAPTTMPDIITTRAGSAVTLDVLANDFPGDPANPDADRGDVLKLVSATLTNQSAGNLQTSGSGVIFTPNTDFSGEAAFTYVVTDNRDGGPTNGEGTITVNALPTATGPSQTLAVAAGQSVTERITGSDPEGRPLSYLVIAAPSAGEVAFDATSPGTFKYTPSASATAGSEDTFTLGVSDGIDVAPVEIKVSITASDPQSPPTGEPVPAPATLQYDTATMTRVQGTMSASNMPTGAQFVITTEPTKGVVEVTNASSGTFTYTANAGVTGSDSFAFAVQVGQTVSPSAIVTIQFAAQGQPGGGGQPQQPSPVMPQDMPMTLDLGTMTQLTGKLKAVIPEGGVPTFVIKSQPTLGSVNLTNATTGEFVYTPNDGATGEDKFTFSVSAITNTGQVSSTTDGTVTITIAAADGPSDPNPASGADPTTDSGGSSSGGSVDLAWLALLVGPLFARRRRFSGATTNG